MRAAEIISYVVMKINKNRPVSLFCCDIRDIYEVILDE